MKAYVSVVGPKIFVASVGTRHFTFTGYGASRPEARAAVAQAWRDHCWQYRAQGEDLLGLWGRELKRQVTVREFRLGCGYRDDQVINTTGAPKY